ncbi:hypothetical protein Bca101_020026 [Brassica carinata]
MLPRLTRFGSLGRVRVSTLMEPTIIRLDRRSGLGYEGRRTGASKRDGPMGCPGEANRRDQLGFKVDDPKKRGGPSELKKADAAQTATVEPEAEKAKKKRKRKRQESEVQENLGEEHAVEAPVGGSSEKKKKKKKPKKKGLIEHRPSSVGSGELRDLARSGGYQDHAASENFRENPHVTSEEHEDSSKGRQEDLEDSIDARLSEHRDEEAHAAQLENSQERLQSRVYGGSETRVSGGPKAILPDRKEEMAREKSLRRELEERNASVEAESRLSRESIERLEQVVGKLERQKKFLEKDKAATSLKHSEEMSRPRKSRKYDVTHERIRVMIAMISKAEKRFHNISQRETCRDRYDDARCLYNQTALPVNPLCGIQAKVFEVIDSSPPDLSGSGADEDCSGTRQGEEDPALSAVQVPMMNEDPPAPTFGRISGPEEADARGRQDPPV